MLPKLETARFALTEYRDYDVPELIETYNDVNTARFIWGPPFPYTKNEAVNWVNANGIEQSGEIGYEFAIRSKWRENIVTEKDSLFLGSIALRKDCTIGSVMTEKARGIGAIPEVFGAIADFVKKNDYTGGKPLLWDALLCNIPSQITAKKLKFKKVDVKVIGDEVAKAKCIPTDRIFKYANKLSIAVHSPDLSQAEIDASWQKSVTLGGEYIKELGDFYDGKIKAFKHVPDISALDFLTDFQRKVYNYLLTIPYGETVTYSKLAKDIGHPNSERAIGNALHNNPYPIVYPCHRVVKSDGVVGDYIYGKEAKLHLLKAEKNAMLH
ncbi:MAG: GNAT family N-acetyltransferase [Bifidobacteriaceae bacterium]|jgi:O-6-methylguanine DNA methyltransferase|nr:GNAT family N-acetyltransferase [Bifidobacteriaceae bacterium]